MGELIINGTNLKQFGVECSGSGMFASPSLDLSYVSIPGRNGDIIISNDRFNNVEIVYPCYIARNFVENFARLKSFLLAQMIGSSSFYDVVTGNRKTLNYAKIEDSYYPDYYRLGMLSGEIVPNVTTRNKGGEFELSFNCQPQRWLKSGDSPTVYTIGTSPGGKYYERFYPYNPTGFESFPVYEFVLTNNRYVQDDNPNAVAVANFQSWTFALNVSAPHSGEYRLDTQTMNLYKKVSGEWKLMNELKTYDYPNTYFKLQPGANQMIVYEGTKVTMYPRWFEV